MPGWLLARTACFPTALGAVGEEFDTGRGAVEQMLARGGLAPPLCLSPFFSSLSSALLPAYFPFRLCPFTSSLRLLSVCFPRRFCRPVFLSSPLSALLSVFLSTFACPPLPFRLRRPPFSLRSVGPLLIPRADYVTRIAGGRGAVREVCDLLLLAQGKLDEAKGQSI